MAITPGQTYGSLTAIERIGASSPAIWSCRCVCARAVTIRVNNLVIKANGSAKCQCAFREQAKIRATRHGESRSAEYKVWCNIYTRCNNPKALTYRDYGGRGITIDERWRDFTVFLADMGRRPTPQHSIERNDNALGYSRENCRWATFSEQAKNKRYNRLMTHDGRTMILSDWAREVGLDIDTLSARVARLAWSDEKAITTPARGWAPTKAAPILFQGNALSIKGWAQKIGIGSNTLRLRLKRWGIERALTAPPQAQYRRRG